MSLLLVFLDGQSAYIVSPTRWRIFIVIERELPSPFTHPPPVTPPGSGGRYSGEGENCASTEVRLPPGNQKKK